DTSTHVRDASGVCHVAPNANSTTSSGSYGRPSAATGTSQHRRPVALQTDQHLLEAAEVVVVADRLDVDRVVDGGGAAAKAELCGARQGHDRFRFAALTDPGERRPDDDAALREQRDVRHTEREARVADRTDLESGDLELEPVPAADDPVDGVTEGFLDAVPHAARRISDLARHAADELDDLAELAGDDPRDLEHLPGDLADLRAERADSRDDLVRDEPHDLEERGDQVTDDEPDELADDR